MCLTCACQVLHPCPPPPASIAAFCNCQGKRKEIESPSENTYHSSPGWREPGLLQKKKKCKMKEDSCLPQGTSVPWGRDVVTLTILPLSLPSGSGQLSIPHGEGRRLKERGREERDGPKMSGSRFESWKWGPQISEGKTRILQTDHCSFCLLYFSNSKP